MPREIEQENNQTKTCYKCNTEKDIFEFWDNHAACKQCEENYRYRGYLRKKLRRLGPMAFRDEIFNVMRNKLKIAWEVLQEGPNHVQRKGRLKKAEKMDQAKQNAIHPDLFSAGGDRIGGVDADLQKRKKVRRSKEQNGSCEIHGKTGEVA